MIESGQNWQMTLGDCVEEVSKLPTDSVHYSIFSPPFSSLYVYSDDYRDMGNCKDDDEFMTHFGFLVDELFRVMMPGRNVSFHCMNLPSTKERDGFIGIRDFRGLLIKAFMGTEASDMYAALNHLRTRQVQACMDDDSARAERLYEAMQNIEKDLLDAPSKSGFIFHSEVCIWKDPVVAMQRTKAIGLLYKQLKKNSCISRQGIPDYLVTMRKPGDNPEPVEKKPEDFPVGLWQEYASPVWMNINPSDTLQRESARENDDERHICPLQLEVIRRGVILWSNKGDTVLSPFAGIGSEGFVSLQEGRKFQGIELKKSYFKQACMNMRNANAQESLFDDLVYAE